LNFDEPFFPSIPCRVDISPFDGGKRKQTTGAKQIAGTWRVIKKGESATSKVVKGEKKFEIIFPLRRVIALNSTRSRRSEFYLLNTEHPQTLWTERKVLS
jgi:hypothetical protein